MKLNLDGKYSGLIFIDDIDVEERYAFILHQFFRALSQITAKGGTIEIIYVEYCHQTEVPNLHLALSPEISSADTIRLFDEVQMLLKAAASTLY